MYGICGMCKYVCDCRVLNLRGMTNYEIISAFADGEDEEEEVVEDLYGEVEEVLFNDNVVSAIRKM